MSKVTWCLSGRAENIASQGLQWVQMATSDNVKYVQAWVDCWFTASDFFLDDPDSIYGDLLLVGIDSVTKREVWREELTWATHSHGLNFSWFFDKYPQYKSQTNIRN